MAIESILTLIGIGLVGGVWNAVAGGATLFTFPALMVAGLPPVAANATNYVAMLPSNAAALPAYRTELRGVGRALIPLVLVSGAGAVVGSCLLLVSDPAVFETLIPWLILAATGLFAYGGALRRCIIGNIGETTGARIPYIALFLFSIYGGYFGAGLGIILLAIVQILGFSSFHVANSLKNLLATCFTVLSIAVFGVGGLIAWPEAAVMMIGSTIGGYTGGRWARHMPERVLKVGVVLFGIALSAVYFVRTFGI